jgi:hypothetical protein
MLKVEPKPGIVILEQEVIALNVLIPGDIPLKRPVDQGRFVMRLDMFGTKSPNGQLCQPAGVILSYVSTVFLSVEMSWPVELDCENRLSFRREKNEVELLHPQCRNFLTWQMCGDSCKIDHLR